MNRIILKVAIRNDIKLSKKQTDFESLMNQFSDDVQFIDNLNANFNKNESTNENETWWPTRSWRSRFMKRYGFDFKKTNKTKYSKRELLAAFVPSLVQTLALRKIFKIQGGKGRIWNLDESMSYLCNPTIQTWGSK